LCVKVRSPAQVRESLDARLASLENVFETAQR